MPAKRKLTDPLKLGHHAARRFRPEPEDETRDLLARIRRKFSEHNAPKGRSKRQLKQDRLNKITEQIKPFAESVLATTGTGAKAFEYSFRRTPVLIVRASDLSSADRLFYEVTGVSPKDSRVTVTL